MRRERIRKNRRTLYLTLTGIGAAVYFCSCFYVARSSRC